MKPAEAYIYNQPALYQNILLHLPSVIQQEALLLFSSQPKKKGLVDLLKEFQLQRSQSDLVGAHKNAVKLLLYFS